MPLGIGSGPTTDSDGADVYQLVCASSDALAPHSTEDLGTVTVPAGEEPAPSFLKCLDHVTLDTACGCTPATLEEAKAKVCARIEARTQALLDGGLVVGGVRVSLAFTGPGLLRWFGYSNPILAAALSFPVSVVGLDGAVLSVQGSPALAGYCAAVLWRVVSLVNAGDSLKARVLAAASTGDLLSVVDARS